MRASWAEGFRAPSIGELFGTQSRFDQTLDDPCSSHDSTRSRRLSTTMPTVRANCIAAGVPANGSYQQANPQISVIVGGNEDLDPETSKSWVLGGVYSPSFLPRLLGRGQLVQDQDRRRDPDQSPPSRRVTNCVVTNDPAACALVTRVNGELTQVSGLLQNIAGIETKGIDLNLAYRTDRDRRRHVRLHLEQHLPAQL